MPYRTIRFTRHMVSVFLLIIFLFSSHELWAQERASGVSYAEVNAEAAQQKHDSDSKAQAVDCNDCTLQNYAVENKSKPNPNAAALESYLAVDLVADRMLLRTGPNSGTEVTNPVAGQSYYVHLEWRNTGSTNAGSFRLEIKLNGTILCAGNLTANANSSHITWCSSAITWPSGTNTIEGVLDVNNSIAESDEANNSASATYGGGGQAELVADRMLLKPGANSGTEVTQPVAGQQYFVHMEWRNTGAVAANNFQVEIRLNGAVQCAGAISGGANTSNIVWCSSAITWPSGANTISGTLDVNNTIAEANETDNEATRTYQPAGPPDIRVDPTSLTINEGAANARGFTPQRGAFDLSLAHAPQRLLVKFHETVRVQANSATTSSAALNALNAKYQVRSVRPVFASAGRNLALKQQMGLLNVYAIELQAGANLAEALQAYAADTEVVYAEPDYLAHAFGNPSAAQTSERAASQRGQDRANAVQLAPNDPLYPKLWGMNNTGQAEPYGGGATVGTPGADISAEAAWDLQTGSSSVIVAVLDDGLDITHPEFSGRVLAGYDFVDNDNDVMPPGNNAHGTSCSGIIAAAGNNGIGVAGVAWNVKIVMGRVLDASGSGTYANIASGVEWAADQGAQVLSMSLGGPGFSQTLEDAVNYAHNLDVLVIAAAGNSNSSQASYPAGYTNCVSVGALSPCNERKRSSSNIFEVNPGVIPDPLGVTCDNEKWWGSNYSSGLDFLAPGTRIYTTDITGPAGYDSGDYIATFNGTSSACPHAAGVAALIRSENPSLTNTEVWAIMQSTAVDLGTAGYDEDTGYGRLNAYQALLAARGGAAGGSFTVFNDGSSDLNVSSITSNRTWLTASPTSFIVSAAGSRLVSVAVDWNAVGNTQQNATLAIRSNDPDEPSVTVLVTAIPNLNPPAITVSTPAAGAVWNIGATQQVAWSSTNVTGNVNIKLSTDGGASFPITLASNTADDGSENVTVPNNPSATCRVRVESVADVNVFGNNPGNFTIQSGSSLNPPRNLTAAAAGSAIDLNWQAPATLAAAANGVEQVRLRAPIAKGANGRAKTANHNSSKVSTNIPEQEPNNSLAQAQALTGASPLVVSGNSEVSDLGAISIVFQDGSTDDLEDLFLVTTTSIGLQIDLAGFNSDCDIWLLDQAATTIIDGSANAGTTPEVISQPTLAAGTYIVGVTIFDLDPSGPSTTPYTLTLTGQFTGGGSSLQSYNIYRAISSPVPIAAQNRIGTVNAALTTFSDGNVTTGTTYFYVTTAVYAQGESGPSNEASAQISGPSIIVTVPAAGATWNVGATQNVAWTSSNVTGNVNLKLSTDGGATFPISLASNTANDGAENVTVPNNPSATCRVRVESVANASVFGNNPGDFTIVGSGGTCDPAACSGPAVFPAAQGVSVVGETIKGKDGQTVCIDIRLKENGQPIDAFGFKLQIDPKQLTFVSVEKGDLTTNFLSVNAQENPAGSGNFTCGGFGVTAIPANSAGVLMRLCFTVKCNAITTSEILLSTPTDDLVGFATCCNRFECVTCEHNGDVNGDLSLTPGDALCAFQIYLNNGSVPASCDVSGFDCEVTASDVNCDNTTTPGDALAIFTRYLQNLPPLDCFARANTAAPAARLNYQLALEARTLVSPSAQQELVKVALRTANPQNLQALGLQLHYPSDQLELLGVTRGALTADWIQLEGQQVEPGIVRLGGFNDKPIAATSAGVLFEVVFANKGQNTTRANFTLTDFVDDFTNAQVHDVSTGVAANAGTPISFKLYQSYPNPFKRGGHGSEMIIRFDLPGATKQSVELAIYNLAGQLVRYLVSGERHPGAYEVRWDGKNEDGQLVPSGTYLYRLKAGKMSESKQLTIVR